MWCALAWQFCGCFWTFGSAAGGVSWWLLRCCWVMFWWRFGVVASLGCMTKLWRPWQPSFEAMGRGWCKAKSEFSLWRHGTRWLLPWQQRQRRLRLRWGAGKRMDVHGTCNGGAWKFISGGARLEHGHRGSWWRFGGLVEMEV